MKDLAALTFVFIVGIMLWFGITFNVEKICFPSKNICSYTVQIHEKPTEETK